MERRLDEAGEAGTALLVRHAHVLEPRLGVVAAKRLDQRPRQACDYRGVVTRLGAERQVGAGHQHPVVDIVAAEVLGEDLAAREVLEETGLVVEIGALFGVYSERGKAVVLIVYTTATVRGEAAAGPEVSEVGWFQPDSLPPLAFPHDYEIIARWSQGAESR